MQRRTRRSVSTLGGAAPDTIIGRAAADRAGARPYHWMNPIPYVDAHEAAAGQEIGQSAIGPPDWLEKGSSASLLARYVSQPIRSSLSPSIRTLLKPTVCLPLMRRCIIYCSLAPNAIDNHRRQCEGRFAAQSNIGPASLTKVCVVSVQRVSASGQRRPLRTVQARTEKRVGSPS